MALILKANEIIAEYAAEGFDLTLRQLYYQFVARDLISNKQSEYKRLGSVINDARLAGLLDWDAIVDRTRNMQKNSHWKTPADIVDTCARSYAIDKWARQDMRPEVWIEKDALVGVISGVCEELDVPYFSCRGYNSQSEMWSAGRRLRKWAKFKGQIPIIFHLGDHDPSGIDMTRDITDRLELFMGGLKVDRLALNMDQVEEHGPPPNPAKLTDTRCDAYIAQFGGNSWELDALDPRTLEDTIRRAVLAVRDEDLWDEAVEEEQEARRLLAVVADDWDGVQEWAEGKE